MPYVVKGTMQAALGDGTFTVEAATLMEAIAKAWQMERWELDVKITGPDGQPVPYVSRGPASP